MIVRREQKFPLFILGPQIISYRHQVRDRESMPAEIPRRGSPRLFSAGYLAEWQEAGSLCRHRPRHKILAMSEAE